jgi:hypothetical protein
MVKLHCWQLLILNLEVSVNPNLFQDQLEYYSQPTYLKNLIKHLKYVVEFQTYHQMMNLNRYFLHIPDMNPNRTILLNFKYMG